MEEERRGVNDLSWYTKYPELATAAASFPYPYRPGMQVPYNVISDVPAQITVPGVMVMDWYPTASKSSLPTDPASVLGKEMYARVRAAYSGTLRADAPDYVVYVLCLDSIFSYIAWLKRLYRCLSAYNPANYVIPDVLLGAMGLTQADIQSLRTNKVQLWQLINELVHQSRKFTCPATMDIMNRHYWMSDNVYTDDATLNSQLYMFNLRGVLRYNELQVSTGSEITASGCVSMDLPWVRMSTDTTVLTPTILYEFGRDLIDRLVAWDDSYTINGYLQRAYEGVPGFVVAELAQEEIIAPVYEPEVLAQIENSHTIALAGAGTIVEPMVYVRQNPDTNAIVSDPQIWVLKSGVPAVIGTYVNNASPNTANPILSMRSDSPTVADNIIASRLNAVTTQIEDTTKIWSFKGQEGSKETYVVHFSCGTEVPVGWFVIDHVSADNTTLMSERATANFVQDILLTKSTVTSAAVNITPWVYLNHASAEAFDWHPKAIVGTLVKAGGTTEKPTPAVVDVRYLGDIHNATAISQADLENLHRICAFSEFNSFSMM